MAPGATDAREIEEDVSPFRIPAKPGRSTRGRRVLKTKDCFAVFDEFGNAEAELAAEGLFFRDMRHASKLVLTLDRAPLLLLSSTISEDNLILSVDLTNPDRFENGHLQVMRDTIHLSRSMLLGEDALFDDLELCNFGHGAARFSIELAIEADFADIFEVRGTPRRRRGAALTEESRADRLLFGYRGLDGVTRRTHIDFEPPPSAVAPDRVEWLIELQPRETRVIRMVMRCHSDEIAATHASRDETLRRAAAYIARRKTSTADIYTDNEGFNDWLGRSRADLDMLITETPEGLYPYAGIPWFSTAFGRDGLITALQCLWFDPELARGTLRFLAARQATRSDPAADAEPGKILHETRKGEMAALGEVPFGCYYGSVDATPLFVMLAAAYHARTGDIATTGALWPHIEAAIRWMKTYGDRDGDGFLEYGRRSENGLANQGWKDSGDAIFHADGALAEGPIALCEVQAYAYAAYRGAADLADLLGLPQQAAEFTLAAATLKDRFERAFWIEELDSYALALDGEKRPCRVRASNAGHALFCGLAAPDKATRIAQSLMNERSFSDWGIRTVAEGEARYNPMSYHDGSVWPHDNGLTAMGFARYGRHDAAIRLFSGLFDAALFMEMKRMPELFCGFKRRAGVAPTSYPVACMPQAWSSAVIFGVLGALLGISFNAKAGQIHFTRPLLPSWLGEVRLANLRLGTSRVDVRLERSRDAAAIHVIGRDGPIEVVVTA